jgi:hypothetical protein
MLAEGTFFVVSVKRTVLPSLTDPVLSALVVSVPASTELGRLQVHVFIE